MLRKWHQKADPERDAAVGSPHPAVPGTPGLLPPRQLQRLLEKPGTRLLDPWRGGQPAGRGLHAAPVRDGPWVTGVPTLSPCYS